MLYANSRAGDTHSVLLVLQGMDTAGKGGIVKHVVGSANPQGISYTSFGAPTEEELAHHYLWRIRKALPQAGHIGVFDRSHYEDVLIVRVHNLVPPDVWGARYDDINAFERELVDGGTTIVKVAMFVSLNEQKKRLAERLDRPDKYWKYNPADIDERKLWPKYQEAYQAVLDRTSTDYAPWYVIPCDRSGTADSRSPNCSSRPSSGSTCLGRRPISTSRPRRSGWRRPEFVALGARLRRSVRVETSARLLAELPGLDHPQQQRRRSEIRDPCTRRTSSPR